MNKTFGTVLKELGPRQVEAVISTQTEDRERDRVMLSGLDLTNYKKNPVVLFAHDYRQPPVGMCKEIGLVSGQLRAVCEFVEPGVSVMADLVCALVKGGQLNATSIGFRPISSVMNDAGGQDFVQAELLEWSFVPVPANPECLVIARSAGLDERRLKEFFSGAVHDLGLGLTAAQVKQAVTEVVEQAVAARVKYEAAARSDAEVLTLSDEVRTAPGHVLVLDDEIDISAADVRAALREAITDTVGQAIRAARGRLPD